MYSQENYIVSRVFRQPADHGTFIMCILKLNLQDTSGTQETRQYKNAGKEPEEAGPKPT
jgi:hypothetical protein